MADFGLNMYDDQRFWIRNAREEQKKSWDEILMGLRSDDNGLNEFLRIQEAINFWTKMSCEEWKQLVLLEKQAEEETKEVDFLNGQALIYNSGEENDTRISRDPKSAWQLYKNKLLSNGFKNETVEQMEKTTHRILKKLSSDTTQIKPVKGLVIGNVQSGKTANMAALMAMAADCGWNMFIILSGTIENLRQQTQNRLLNDLNCPGNLNWIGLEHLSKKPALGQRAQDLHFEANSKQRYFTVCLKNPGRLRGLIQWLQSDSHKQKQMKILVIDDEADQAGINTADVKGSTIRMINKLIRNLVNGKNEKSQDIDTKYCAMNYVGYTATPYANVLNEAGEDSLYPQNFIATLSVSKEYFGPQQIFGLEGGDYDYDGLDIVNIISERDLQIIKDIHEERMLNIPKTLQDAICWFMCGVACMRIWNYKKPISMLIHTSQKTDHHENIALAVKEWISNKNIEEMILRCKRVWERETKQFSFEKFRKQYGDYDRKDEEINRYPEFEKVEEQLKILLNRDVSNIPLDEQDDLVYHEGIHMCVDNCKNNGVNDDGMYVRLAYPISDNMPSPAPAFIVIGGATLSRGLTIEGLISTFFLRSVSQADTLMQMGRWFGYRQGYELLPRLWITSKTNDQFKFLSELDQELRNEIHEMEILGKCPAQYGPRVKNTPKVSFIRITAKNRMQSAKSTDMDFSGSFNQTYLFDNNKEILSNNIKVTEDFILSLGKQEKHKECNSHANNTVLWRNIDFSKIKVFLKKFKFNQRLSVFNDINSVISWIEKITKDGKLDLWNVILAGKISNKNSVWKSPIGPINKISRTRKSRKNESDETINIGVLRDPKDIIADVDLEGKDQRIIKKVKNFKSKEAKVIRNLAGLNMVPQIIIYMIDKDSKASANSTRIDLNAKEDIVGICINIPGGKRGTNYTETVSIHLRNNIFNDEGDLEEIDEN